MVVQSDIEIYVRDCSNERLLEWLTSAFGKVVFVDHAGKMAIYRGRMEGNDVPIMLTPGMEGGPFTSVWINSPHRPWSNDVDCARQAARDLGREVRCDPMAIRPTAAPSEFLRILDGREEFIDWGDDLIDRERL